VSILKLLGQHKFDIDTTKVLASAFDLAWLTLQKNGGELVMDSQAAGTRDLLARRIVEIAANGETSLRLLVDGALSQFAASK
jgi:hypothetical protein